VSESEKKTVDQQCKWLAEVDAQDPILYPGSSELETVETFGRPTSLSAVPKLQGPFQLAPEPDFGEITDIHVIAPKIDDGALYDDVNEDEESDEGLSVGIVCLATSTNEIHVCLDVDGVEAEWLPSKRSRTYTFDDVDDLKELVLFETIDLAQTEADDDGWPTFTPSPVDRYEFFATHSTGVCSLSLRPWISMLEDELSAPSDSGAAFRIDIVLDTAHTSVDQAIDLPASDTANTAVALFDPSLGYLVLTTVNNTPYASVLSTPTATNHFAPDDAPSSTLAQPAPEPRAPYRPAAEFEQPSALPQLLKSARDRNLLGTGTKSEVRFSPATLQLLTEAHRIMSSDTHRLGMAAAELFRRCERMRAELREQVRKVSEVAERVDTVTGNDETVHDDIGEGLVDDEDDEENLVGRERIEHRIELVHEKSTELNARYERLRRKMGRLGGKELSAREKAFQTEVGKLERSVLPQPSPDESAADDSPETAIQPSTLASRFDAALALQQDLLKQVEEAAERVKKERSEAGKESTLARASGGSIGVGSQYQKKKLAQVMQMLEREEALLEAAKESLARLQRG
jgi:nucleoporin NUP82